MKKILLSAFFICVFSGLCISEEITVYITKSGEKYHLEGCRYLGPHKIPISLDLAIANGFEPCKICNPPESLDENEKTGVSPLSSNSDSVASEFPCEITGKVVSITDGDTIIVLKGNTQYKIRLNAIDSPESSQSFGKKAKDFISSLLYLKDVEVNILEMDKYGRFIGNVYLDNDYINEEIVKAGYAWHYKEYSKDENLEYLEKQARKNRIGLWQDSSPTPPWDYRN